MSFPLSIGRCQSRDQHLYNFHPLRLILQGATTLLSHYLAVTMLRSLVVFAVTIENVVLLSLRWTMNLGRDAVSWTKPLAAIFQAKHKWTQGGLFHEMSEPQCEVVP